MKSERSYSHLIRRIRQIFNFSIGIFIGLLMVGFASYQPIAAAQLPQATPKDLVPLDNIAQISAGYVHTCAVTTDNKVKCWGYNVTPIGDNPFDLSNAAIDMTAIGDDVASVESGTWYTCALTTEGDVKCWGTNLSGQFGDGTTSHSRSEPRDVALEAKAQSITVSSNHACALTMEGGVKCWGDNSSGQLGDGTTTNRLTPVDVIDLQSGVMAIEANNERTCAIITDGSVKCWGLDGYDSSSGFAFPIVQSNPVNVAQLDEEIIDIALGRDHTCIITTDGRARCWGSNQFGQLGNGAAEDEYMDINDVAGIDMPVAEIEIGTNSSCARATDKSAVYCWGNNSNGKLGNGNISGPLGGSRVAVEVVGLEGEVDEITLGDNHACALMNDGEVRCWGTNGGGQLGNGVDSAQRTPDVVMDLDENITKVAVGNSHTCALSSDGVVSCWGTNEFKQLGRRESAPSFVPIAITESGSGVSTLESGDSHTCALMESGTVNCWGFNQSGQLGIAPGVPQSTAVNIIGLDSAATTLALGNNHSCALTTSGSVICWGENGLGQLGNGTTDSPHWPSSVIGLSPSITAIASGSNHACALNGDGDVKCWGANSSGQLGNGTTDDSTEPVDVTGLQGNAIAIAAGGRHSCAVTKEHTVQCWGDNSVYQLGSTSISMWAIPTDVADLSSVIALAAGGLHTCALTDTGDVQCWGYNENGQLGNDQVFSSPTPLQVTELSNVIEIKAGYGHNCAIQQTSTDEEAAGGELKCWGGNYNGQIGNGEAGYSATPVVVLGEAAQEPGDSTSPTEEDDESANIHLIYAPLVQ